MANGSKRVLHIITLQRHWRGYMVLKGIHRTVTFDLVTLTFKFYLLLTNFNLDHNFTTRRYMAFKLHMGIPCDKTFPGLRRCNFPVVDWRGVGSNPAGDIYFHFEFFAPSPFRTGQRSRCKWNQACPFTWSHSCFRPQIWFIIQGLVYKYLQYSFKDPKSSSHVHWTIYENVTAIGQNM